MALFHRPAMNSAVEFEMGRDGRRGKAVHCQSISRPAPSPRYPPSLWLRRQCRIPPASSLLPSSCIRCIIPPLRSFLRSRHSSTSSPSMESAATSSSTSSTTISSTPAHSSSGAAGSNTASQSRMRCCSGYRGITASWLQSCG